MKPDALYERLRPWYATAAGLLLAVAELVNRVWVASVFWKSGVNKYESWSSTMYLFRQEYAVPLLDPETAAYLATAAELSLPVLLAFGLLGRLSAGALFLFNVVAVISYPGLNAAGIQGHMIWGLMLLVPLLRGPGWLSADGAVRWWFEHRRGTAAGGQPAPPPRRAAV